MNTPQDQIDYNNKMQVVTALVELTFVRGKTNERVIWQSFQPLPSYNAVLEAKARTSLRLGKRTWKLVDIHRWSLRGW